MNFALKAARLPLRKPFAIAGSVYHHCDTLRLTLKEDGLTGTGEAIGVDYLGESIDSMIGQLDSIGATIENGIEHDQLSEILPAGGARNALDCALWDLRAKRENRRVWQLLGVASQPVQTVFTIGIDDPQVMAADAAAAAQLPKLKIKLDSHQPIERLEAIRAARPDATLIVDANQGWDRQQLSDALPHLERLGIAMLEQPLPRGSDEDLAGLVTSVPIGADESIQHSGEFAEISKLYDVINIKLDKCGGLTDAMKLVHLAREHDKRLMVGCMVGSSYSMAPAFVIAQACEFVDIDGPLLLKTDVPGGLEYGPDGVVRPPTPDFWG
ncbi:MAG: dipeptide epimerase [Pseudomonadota bacterium]